MQRSPSQHPFLTSGNSEQGERSPCYSQTRDNWFPSKFAIMLPPPVGLPASSKRLEDVLLSLQRHYDRQLRMAADIRGAVAVPVTLLAVMVAVVVLLMTQVLPVFDRVFAQLGVRMGAVATGMMNAGAVLAQAGIFSS